MIQIKVRGSGGVARIQMNAPDRKVIEKPEVIMKSDILHQLFRNIHENPAKCILGIFRMTQVDEIRVVTPEQQRDYLPLSRKRIGRRDGDPEEIREVCHFGNQPPKAAVIIIRLSSWWSLIEAAS